MTVDNPKTQRVHVLMPAPFEKPGGLHSYVRGLAQGQRELGHSVVIVDSISKSGSYRFAEGAFDPSLPTVAQYHFALGALPLLYVRYPAWKSSASVFHFHGPWHDEGRLQGDSKLRRAFKRTIEKLVYRRFDKFVTASDAFQQVLTEDFGVSPTHITTVHPGVDTDRFSTRSTRAEARQRLGLTVSGPLLVSVRRLEPRMGLEFAIDALTHLPGMELAIAGQGSLRPSLEAHAQAVGVADRVTFLGRVSDEALPDVYRAGDVSIVPTVGLEGFGMVVLESMAAGTPVVSTDVGGLPEAMGPFTRFAVPSRDAVALAEAVGAAVADPQLSEAVHQYALTRSFRAMAAEVDRAVIR